MAHQLDDFGGACLVKFAIPTTEAFDKEVGVYFECFLKRIGHVPLQVPCVTCVIERVPLFSINRTLRCFAFYGWLHLQLITRLMMCLHSVVLCS